MDLRKGLAAISSSFLSSPSKQPVDTDRESSFQVIAEYSRSLMSCRSREEVSALTLKTVQILLDVEQPEVVFRTAEVPALLETSKLGAPNFLAYPGVEVSVRGQSTQVALLRIPEKNDWTALSKNEMAVLEAIAAPMGLRLECLRLEEELALHQAGSIRALSAAIEVKDRYTSGHTKRVGFYANAITLHLSVSAVEREKIRLAGVLHDIGKIGVPDRILLKPGKLTEGEWDEMRLHTEAGFDIVSQVAGLEEIAEILRHHHERWDGSGYPRGLRGEEIPFASRVISVADTFDAIVTDRPYRKALTPEQAREIIIELAGEQFDPTVVEGFRSAFESLASQVELPAVTIRL
ncbi:MAG: HD-GYP domain-containing protein [Cryobacterium sp.]|nr:HD-GYP domain-containing protein [Oligoflexia bacterium]